MTETLFTIGLWMYVRLPLLMLAAGLLLAPALALAHGDVEPLTSTIAARGRTDTWRLTCHMDAEKLLVQVCPLLSGDASAGQAWQWTALIPSTGTAVVKVSTGSHTLCRFHNVPYGPSPDGVAYVLVSRPQKVAAPFRYRIKTLCRSYWSEWYPHTDHILMQDE